MAIIKQYLFKGNSMILKNKWKSFIKISNIIFILIIFGTVTYSQTIMVYDITTNKPVTVGVITVSYYISSWDRDFNKSNSMRKYFRYGTSSYTNMFPLTGEPIKFAEHYFNHYLGPQKIVIECPNYERKEVEMAGLTFDNPTDLYIRSSESLSENLNVNAPHLDFNYKIYIVPQKLNVDAKVNLQETSGVVEKSNELDIFTADQIANFLHVELSEILKLIKEKKLKAKKIGDTYFIRKKDFDSYMEK